MAMDDETVQLRISVDKSRQELLIAELLDRGFDAFDQSGPDLLAYCQPSVWSEEIRLFLRQWLEAHETGVEFSTETIAPRNWNEQWEASLGPTSVGRFTIKPSWLDIDVPDDRIVIEIDPKMSFGTGYHASTRLALRLLDDGLHPGDRVLDAGTGTGILSIAAARLGAGFVFAFDNDPWAYRNTLENIQRNDVDQNVTTRLGDVECIPDGPFDVVVANIHLTVIEAMMPAFASRLMPGGTIIVSGLLRKDDAAVHVIAARNALRVTKTETEDEWLAAALAPVGS